MHRPFFILFLSCLGFTTFADKPNVLFIAIDDLRPALGCYGDQTAITPNIDRLASRGTVFQRAYCQEAVCSPSRLSLITGRRPDSIKVWDLATHFRESLPDIVTLPQHFKKNGYHTQAIGKILHGGGKPSTDPPSWSVDPMHDRTRSAEVRYATKANLAGKGLKRAASESADVPDNTYIDGIVCDDSLIAMEKLKEQDKPFFLAVGFRKPHLPFCAPSKYWDLHDRKDIPVPVTSDFPENSPELATRSWRELEGYTDIPEDGQLTAAKIQELRHGYYACVSYIDAQVGRLLKKLDDLDLTRNTVICLWGDHGFHLGEQGLWTKANNYELSTRVPLILVTPNHPSPGNQSNALVEFVDVYPSLVEACGLTMPKGLEGISFLPLLKAPDLAWKKAAFSQYPRPFEGNRHKRHGDIMGRTIRTHAARYVEWKEWESNKVVARELYDHESDPNEMKNIAGEETGQKRVLRLSRLLNQGWKQALPTTNVPVFQAGTEGYNIFRIPATVRAANGDLLVFCEAREGGDASTIDLVMKRSNDHGQTWGPLQVVMKSGDFTSYFKDTPPPITVGNPAPVVDLLSQKHPGRIWLPFTLENDQVFTTYSDDHGKTWSPHREITASVKRDHWAWYATGPVHSIQIQRGRHKGRLVIPCDHRVRGTDHKGAHVVFSDDHGETWEIGAVDETYEDGLEANETTVAELNDGTLLFNTRNQKGKAPGTRGVAWSRDGGLTFESGDTNWKQFKPELGAMDPPVVQCALLRVSDNLILFSGPDENGPSGKSRSDLRIRWSDDEGQTWKDGPMIHVGPAAYSDMVNLDEHHVGIVYECGDPNQRSSYKRIDFKVLDLELVLE